MSRNQLNKITKVIRYYEPAEWIAVPAWTQCDRSLNTWTTWWHATEWEISRRSVCRWCKTPRIWRVCWPWIWADSSRINLFLGQRKYEMLVGPARRVVDGAAETCPPPYTHRLESSCTWCTSRRSAQTWSPTTPVWKTVPWLSSSADKLESRRTRLIWNLCTCYRLYRSRLS